MFYIKEFYLKSFFFFLSCILVIAILYLNKFNLIWLITSPILYFLKQTTFSGVFIYTHPIEFFIVIFNLILYFTIIFIFPYLLWLFLDFFKSGLFLYEYILIKKKIFFILSTAIILNIIGFSFFLPSIWFFFESFNTNILNDIKILMEIKIQDYFYFVFDYIVTINFAFLLIFCFYFYFSVYSTSFIIKNKNILFALNIIAATILSPPELIFQIIIFLILVCFSESLILYFLFFKIINKVIN